MSAGVQAAYWHMLEEGRITRTATLILMQSVDEALDKVSISCRLQTFKIYFRFFDNQS